MTARSRRRFHAVLWMACCLLVAQWAVAAHACAVALGAGHLQALAQTEAHVAEAAPAASGHPCHDVEVAAAGDPADASAVCMKHCADESGATGGALTVVTAAMAPPAVMRTLVLEPPVLVHWEQAPAGADATAPPFSILFGVFLS